MHQLITDLLQGFLDKSNQHREQASGHAVVYASNDDRAEQAEFAKHSALADAYSAVYTQVNNTLRQLETEVRDLTPSQIGNVCSDIFVEGRELEDYDRDIADAVLRAAGVRKEALK